jgi:hypothetical protein
MAINHKVIELNWIGIFSTKETFKQSSQEALTPFTCFKGRDYITLRLKNNDVYLVRTKLRLKGPSETTGNYIRIINC